MLPLTLFHLLLLTTVAGVHASPLSVPVDGSLSHLGSRAGHVADRSVNPVEQRSDNAYAALDDRALDDASNPPPVCHDVCFGGTSDNLPVCQNDQESVACACSAEAINEFRDCFACVQELDPNSAYLDGPDGTPWSAEQWADALTESCADSDAFESQLASSIAPSATDSLLSVVTSIRSDLASASVTPIAALQASDSNSASLAASSTSKEIDLDSTTAIAETLTSPAKTSTSTAAAALTPTSSSKLIVIVTTTAALSAANVAPATLTGLVPTTSVAVVAPAVSSGAGIAAEPSVNYIAGPSAKVSAGERTFGLFRMGLLPLCFAMGLLGSF